MFSFGDLPRGVHHYLPPTPSFPFPREELYLPTPHWRFPYAEIHILKDLTEAG
jgi:serine phosphatase RsbU (regulator of sigma subunit)